jgi:hypothetical protein
MPQPRVQVVEEGALSPVLQQRHSKRAHTSERERETGGFIYMHTHIETSARKLSNHGQSPDVRVSVCACV